MVLDRRTGSEPDPHIVPENPLHPFVWLGVILLVLWAVLWLGFHIVAGIIHILVIVGVALLVWGLVKKGARAVRGDRH